MTSRVRLDDVLWYYELVDPEAARAALHGSGTASSLHTKPALAPLLCTTLSWPCRHDQVSKLSAIVLVILYVSHLFSCGW